MALTAMEIFKLLPKTNCGDCGVPTCLAFAMKLANKQAELSACPHVTDDAKSSLDAASQPPQRLVKIGTGDTEVQIGNETELFRHEKKFFHPTAYALQLTDDMDAGAMSSKLEELNSYELERVGQILSVNLVAVRSVSGDAAKFAAATGAVAAGTQKAMILVADGPDVMRSGVEACAGRKPLLHAATKDNWEAMAVLAKEKGCPLAVLAPGLDELAELAEKVKGAGVEDMVLDMGKLGLKDIVNNFTMLRRLALKKSFRPLGYPVMLFAGGDGEKEGLQAAMATMKYGGIVVLKDMDAWKLFPLFTLRQNIYTDPQVPIQVKPELYPINNPDENSPLLLTTNFSLTYFTVQGDIEGSKVPAWLQVVDTEGLSVMTAFAAEKLTAEGVTKTLEDQGIKEKLAHNDLVIPGMVARMSGKLGETSGRNIVVGPNDSSGIPKFLKEYKPGG